MPTRVSCSLFRPTHVSSSKLVLPSVLMMMSTRSAMFMSRPWKIVLGPAIIRGSANDGLAIILATSVKAKRCTGTCFPLYISASWTTPSGLGFGMGMGLSISTMGPMSGILTFRMSNKSLGSMNFSESICMRDSLTLPQTGIKPGVLAGGGKFHESIARTLGRFSTLQNFSVGSMFRVTSYSSGFRPGMLYASKLASPRSVHVPLLFQSM